MKLTNLVPSIPDERDLLYIPLTGTVADETDLVTWQSPTEKQEQQESCTSFGVSRADEILSKQSLDEVGASVVFESPQPEGSVRNGAVQDAKGNWVKVWKHA